MSSKTFKEKRTRAQRSEESRLIRDLHPTKVPVIVERFRGEKEVPNMDRSKFLVPDHLNVGEFLFVIRRNLRLSPNQALFLLVNETAVSSSTSLGELYLKEKDPDGFIYFTYASHETFG